MMLLLGRGDNLFEVGFAGMELVMGRFQIGDGQMQVKLGRGQKPVARDLLHMAQVGLVLRQMRGHEVAQTEIA